MAVQSKPIPALYVVYILRSTVRHKSLYIGSTPNPPRRLKQHNGETKGGATRTAKRHLRPWEMVAVVSGFPGLVAALQFEWALNNPHVSLRIDPRERISISTARKRNGCPRRPSHTMPSVISNLHLLLRVPGFSRWPLTLHFFDRDVHAGWAEWCAETAEAVRSSLSVVTDFGPAGGAVDGNGVGSPWGVHALPLDYAPMTDCVEESRSVFSFEREGDCVVCGEVLEAGKGLHAICSNRGCEGVGHLKCWSHQLGKQDSDPDAILPMEGKCPKCKGAVRWGDMMRELTLRLRGEKEVEKLLKRKQRQLKADAKAKKAKDKVNNSA